MEQAKVSALRSVEIGVTNMDEAVRFYKEVWGLTSVGGDQSVHYLRGTAPFHHILALRKTDRPALIRIVFDAKDRATVDALHRQAVAHAAGPVEPPGALDQPLGEYGFGCKDVEGRNIIVVTGVKDHVDGQDQPDRPRRLSHVNLNVGDAQGSLVFFQNVLGFRLSDTTKQFHFLRCHGDHHTVVLAFGNEPTLNHIAFEMPDLDSVMRGAGRMRDHGYPIEWGPGRHGPGANVFCYFVGPEELPIEFTAEMQQVDDSYKAGTPDDWTWPPRRVDRWGISDPPSARVKRVGHLFRFVEDGYRLKG
jgi:catechol 2,3-dioxygenase